MYGEDPTNDIQSIQVPNARLTCSAIRGQPQVGLRSFIWITARMMSTSGPFGPGLDLRIGENNSRYFRRTSARWKFNRVEGFSAMATRGRRFVLTKRAESGDEAIQNPEIRSALA
jgi:hypothetical protein